MQVRENEAHAFSYETAVGDKTKVSLEDSELSLPRMRTNKYNIGSQYYNQLTHLQEDFQFDNIVSISPLSVQNLRKFAESNEVKEIHWFLLPGEAKTAVGKIKNIPNKEVKSVALSILKTLEFSEDAINTVKIGPTTVSDDFEAMIMSSKIYNLKSEMKTFDYLKIGSWILISLGLFSVASVINVHMINLTMGRTTV